MPKFSVTVIQTYTGELYVEAADRDEAIRKAQAIYRGVDSLSGPCCDTDWPDEGDEESDGVQEIDEEEWDELELELSDEEEDDGAVKS